MKYEAFCEDHNLKLVDGCCPECRDAAGNMFFLDMQSYYLKPVQVSDPVAQTDRAAVS